MKAKLSLASINIPSSGHCFRHFLTLHTLAHLFDGKRGKPTTITATMMDDHLSSHLFYPETPLVSPPGWASNLDQADNAGMPLSKEADTIPEVLKPKRPRTAVS